MTSYKIIGTAALMAGLAVMLGAFGAHGLETQHKLGNISLDQLEAYRTAADYQLYHALALLGLGALAERMPQLRLKAVYYLFVVGVLLFSGSIYLLSCRNILGLGEGFRALGPITPLGGLLLIVGWFLLAWQAFRQPKTTV